MERPSWSCTKCPLVSHSMECQIWQKSLVSLCKDSPCKATSQCRFANRVLANSICVLALVNSRGFFFLERCPFSCCCCCCCFSFRCCWSLLCFCCCCCLNTCKFCNFRIITYTHSFQVTGANIGVHLFYVAYSVSAEGKRRVQSLSIIF